MYVLSGIILLNIIAILLLNNRLAEQEQAKTIPPPPQAAPPPVIVTPRAAVRTLIIEDKTRCPDCFDVREYITTLNDTVDMRVETVPTGQLTLFKSDKLPAIAFNASIEAYPTLVQGWDTVGYTVALSEPYAGTWYVLPTQNAPFYADGRVHGRVSVTYITMRSCTECYDVAILNASLATSRITPYRETTVDAESTEGKALLAKYNITAVPTLIMDGEAAAYPNLQPGWNIVGTIEEDGTYVLHDLQRLQVTYYDLALKKLMKP